MTETTRDVARTKRGATPPRSSRPRRKATPGVTPLEGRALLSFAPVNPEFLVSTGATLDNRQTNPDVAMAANGDFVVVWQYRTGPGEIDILMRRYFADGTPKTANNEFVSNSTLVDRNVAVAMAPDGRYVVTWMRASGEGNSDVIAARFLADGTNLGEFTVPTVDLADRDQSNPDVAMSADGSFGIVWTNDSATTGSDVRYRAYNANGQPITGDVAVATSASAERRPSISRRPNPYNGVGPFQVITWTENGAGNDNIGYRVDPGPVAAGAVGTANVTTEGPQLGSVAAMDGSGNFTIAWNDLSGSTGSTLNFRQFAGANSTPLTDADRTAVAGNTGLTRIASAINGRLVIAYEDASDTSVRYIPITPTGVVEAPVRYDVNHGLEINPQVALSPSGTRMVVVADDDRIHTYDAYARVFQRAQTPSDYDGDGKSDPAVYGYGRLAFRPSRGGTDVFTPFGGPQDAALVGDFDGDGKSDLAVYGYGRLAYRPSTGGTDVFTPFGGPQDRAVAGDYDGDGKTDLAVYGYGRLAYRPSRGGTDVVVAFGGPQDQAIAGDYDGDGKTDLAVYGYGRLAYRPSTTGIDVFIPYGGPQDAAVAGDYDGDGRTDIGVFGYTRLAWQPSGGGAQVFVTFGGPADIPLPLPTPRAQAAGAASAASFRASVASARLLDYDSALDAVAGHG